MRSLSEAPKYASVIATILKPGHYKAIPGRQISNENISMQGKCWFGLFRIATCIIHSIRIKNIDNECFRHFHTLKDNYTVMKYFFQKV